ncbi:MAG: cyclase family protein [Acidobacteria bacterium]|nr:cyclase family protein [Acidobacteriota bacterium]
MKIVDLSHPIIDGMITYPGLPGPMIGDFLDREASRKLYDELTEFHIGRIDMVANTGTYVDVPYHRYSSGLDLERFPLEGLVNLEGVVIEAVDTLAEIETTRTRDELSGKAVLIRTGWSRHWGTATYVEGEYPFLSEGLVEQLIDAEVALVGIDSLNVDDNRRRTRPAHSRFLASRIPIVEHLTGLDTLPADGFIFFAAPPAVRGVGSFPVRAFALVP